MMSSSPLHDQNSAASVISIAISVVATKATSGCSSPNPLSIYWVKTPRKRSMTPVPPMAHSLSDGEINGHPCGTRLLSFRSPGAGKPMFGALSSRCEVGDGVLLCPRNWRRCSAQTRRHASRASFCSGATLRHRANSTANGSASGDADDADERCSSPPRSLMAQAATTRTITATPATIDSRSILLRALMDETSSRRLIDSRRQG